MKEGGEEVKEVGKDVKGGKKVKDVGKEVKNGWMDGRN